MGQGEGEGDAVARPWHALRFVSVACSRGPGVMGCNKSGK